VKPSVALGKIRRCFRTKKYEITLHAVEELAADRLRSEDLASIILGGKIVNRFTEDPRGVRYEVAGVATDGREACAVCRFVNGTLRIITVYARNLDSIQ
jgi:hypothetical protein